MSLAQKGAGKYDGLAGYGYSFLVKALFNKGLDSIKLVG